MVLWQFLLSIQKELLANVQTIIPPINPNQNDLTTYMSAKSFSTRFRNLIILAWLFPPVLGISFIMYIGVLSSEQILGLLTAPTEPLYIIGWLIFAAWYFPRHIQAVPDYLISPEPEKDGAALASMQGFIVRFWSIFLIYLLLAPGSVIISAEYYTDYVAQPVDWFRIQLIALIVSIIVGLPIFFLVLDLFGKSLGNMRLSFPHITIKVKVFLIGAMIPLLIDTMLVQYYWTRTSYFTLETFIVWLSLEVLAIVASIVFSNSFAQSIAPLQNMAAIGTSQLMLSVDTLLPQSTDELGVLTINYRKLLQELRSYSEVLELSNRVLRELGRSHSIAQSVDMIVVLCNEILKTDKVFLILYNAKKQKLVGVAHTGAIYNAEGYFELGLNETSLAVLTFNGIETINIQNADHDPRCSPKMLDRFSVKSALSTPLRIEDKAIGVLMAVSTNTYINFEHRDETIIEALANETALAIHTEKLHGERERAIDERRERDELISLLMASTEEGIYGVNLDGTCTFINHSALKMLGYQQESELLGKGIHDLIHHTFPDGRPYPKEQCQIQIATLEGKRSNSADELHWRRDGTSFPIEYWSRPVTKNGNIVGAVVTFVDITERKKIEKELHQHRHQLSELVNIRTSDADRINRELESFSYSVSHDLRAPLRSMAGFSDILLEDYSDKLDDTGKNYLDRIKRSAHRMGQLIDDLLNLTRINRCELKLETVNMTKLAQGLIKLHQQNEPDRVVKINIKSNLEVNGDEGMLRIMLDNLIGNSWKYTSREAEAKIEFTSKNGDQGIVYYIRDNGVGFDIQHVDRIFKPFERLHTENEFPGTGIGLATVKRVIERHGGKIWVESEQGKGSCFYFTLS